MSGQDLLRTKVIATLCVPRKDKYIDRQENRSSDADAGTLRASCASGLRAGGKGRPLSKQAHAVRYPHATF